MPSLSTLQKEKLTNQQSQGNTDSFTAVIFLSLSEKESHIIQNYTVKYTKWLSAYAKYLCKTISLKGINSKLSNCYIGNCMQVSKKLGNEEIEDSMDIHTSPFAASMADMLPVAHWSCVVNWMTQNAIRESSFLCSENCLARSTPFSQVLYSTAGDRIFLERIQLLEEKRKSTSAVEPQHRVNKSFVTTFKYS